VDDELGPREALRMILKSQYQVMTASSGADALQHLRKSPVDLVLLDIKMREMNGIEMLKAIKELDAGIEVVMMTAYASLETAREAIAYGASEYLVKPFSKQEVVRAVDKAMARRAERAGARLEVRALWEHMRSLARASSTAAGESDLLQSASGVLEQVKRLLGATVAVLHMREGPGQRLMAKVVLGLPRQQHAQFDAEAWVTPLGQTLKARLPCLLAAGQPGPQSDGMVRAMQALGYYAGAFFPVLMGDAALGVLGFLYESARELPTEWTDIGRTVAELIALALRTHQRYDTSRQEAVQQAQRAAQLTILREMGRVIIGNPELPERLQAIGHQLQAGLGYAGCYIWLYGRDGTQLYEAYGSGPNYGWQLGHHVDRGRLLTLHVERAPEAHMLLAPIAREGTPIGIIKLIREIQQGPIAESEIELVSMLLDYMGVAVQNSQLYGEIKETKSFLENLINGAGDAILTVDREDRVTSWNTGAEQIFQYPNREMLQQKIWQLLPRELYAQWRDEVLQGDGVKRVEARLQRRDGTPIDVSLTLSPLHGPQDAIAGFVAIIKDVTQEKQLQEQVFRSEKLSGLGEMAAGIAHNFNNMLMTMLARAQLLERDPTDVEAVQAGLASIKVVIKDAAAMVRRIQQFSKASAKASTGEAYSMVDLNQLVHEVINATELIWTRQVQREQCPINVVLDLGTLPPVRGCSSELREVLTNLILNAVDAMPAGGQLAVRTRAQNRGVSVEVADTGVGMSEEVQYRIFDPFFSTKGPNGTGLGLSVSHTLIKGHQGDIVVQSTPGQGTTFVITLPVVPGVSAVSLPAVPG